MKKILFIGLFACLFSCNGIEDVRNVKVGMSTTELKYFLGKEASEKTGLSLFKVVKLSNGEKNNKKQSIEINGIKYESLTEASEKTGLSLFLINKIKK